MTLDLYATGSTSAYNFDVPTNPLMTTQSSFGAGTDVLYSAIYTDDSEETIINEIVSSATLQAEYENLSVSKGFNIRCFDTVSSIGKDLSSIASTINDYYYFVLIHSDNHLKHHFARITEIKSADALGDSFDFEPKLGNEIAQGTKFKLFKGPATSSKGVAFSAGIKLELQNELQVARPHFWFVNDSLDKKNQLNHNTKYFARMEKFGDGSSVTMNGLEKVTFVTVTDYAQKVIDYSKYSLSASITDVLRTKDAIGTYASNEGITLATQNDADYDLFAPNAVRDTDDNVVSTGVYVTKGPRRYLHYDFSPIKNNSTINVIDLEVQESIGAKASFVDLQISDPYRILSKKINNYDALRIRQMIHRGDFNDWASFGATISSYGNTNSDNQPSYDINTPVDLTNYINAGDEVLINSRIMVVRTVTSTVIRFYDESRLETDSIFTNSTNLESIAADTIIYRRAWNTKDGTLLTGMRMIDGRQDSLSISLISDEFSQLEATVTSYVSQTGLLTLSLFNQGYDTKTALDKMSGQYIIYNEKLNGRVVNLKQQKTEGGATVMNINGADKLKELLDPIIEKNTLFSKDIVYSTNSPYNKLTAMGVNAITNFDSVILGLASSYSLSVGDKIYTKSPSGAILFLGVIASGSGTSYNFVDFARAEAATWPVYKASTKYTVFNKALSSNSFVSSATSLYGTANKGLFFESGLTLVNGEETEILSGSSINTTNSKARGYYLSEPTGLKSDNLFQARLDDDDDSSKSYATFDTLNTLIDFNILSIRNVGENQVVEIAPHIPLTLARVDVNYANTQDTTFTLLGLVSTGQTDRYIKSTVAVSELLNSVPKVLSLDSKPRRYHGKAIYVNDVFVGFMTMAVLQSNGTDIYIYLDREATTTTDSTISVLTDYHQDTVVESSKLTHELSLLNGAHLHGGKIITLLNSVRGNSSEPLPLDFPLLYSAGDYASSNSERFGSPYYRIMNIEKGNVSPVKPTFTTVSDTTGGIYEKQPSKISYYASSYKFNPAFYIDSVFKNEIAGTDKFDSEGWKHTLLESRGLYPPSGSNFFDVQVLKGSGEVPFTNFHFEPRTHHENSESTSNKWDNLDIKHEKTPFAIKDLLWQPDSKVSRMFLFLNSDLDLYSSVRKDSLLYSGQSRDISKYNLFALSEATEVNSFDAKDNVGVATKRLSFKDGNYSSSSIISSEKTLSTLNRFGMMRLTELCFDWAFNQFDPENPPDKREVLPIMDYYTHVHVENVGTLHATPNADETKLKFTGNVTVTGGDLLLDKHGRFIGIVSSGVTSTIVDLVENRYNTDGVSHNVTTNGIYKITSTNISKISGSGIKDSIIDRYSDISMHKGAVFNRAATAVGAGEGYGQVQWYSQFGNRVLGVAGVDATRKQNMILPLNIQSNSALITSEAGATMHSSQIMEIIGSLNIVTGTGVASGNSLFMKYWLPVFLDRYSIEDGTQLVSSGMVGAYITATTKTSKSATLVSDEDHTFGVVGHTLNSNFVVSETEGGTAIAGADLDKLGDGAFLGFKPRLYIAGSATSNAASVGNQTIYRYNIAASGQHKWLSHVNLTGTYLPVQPRYLNNGAQQTLSSLSQGHDDAGITSLAYCISHEIDHSNSTETHILTFDAELMAGGYHRIMQPNHTCTYDFTPKMLKLNTLSSRYTKMPYENKTYENINNYSLKNAKGSRELEGNNEGVMSMYVLIDVENLSSQKRNIVPSSNLSTLLNGKDGKYCISDGDMTYRANLTYEHTGPTAILEQKIQFDVIKETKGVVSVSEITSITVGGETPIDTDSKRATIGSVVNICQEAESIIEELFEEQDTPFSITKQDYPLFVAPNFNGISIFEAINFLLQRKDQTLIQNNETFEIKPKDSTGFYNDLLISDDGDIRIYEYEVLDSTFDEFNEIIVNGKFNSSKKQDLRSVNKIGKKTLKVFERKLTTQEEVDTRAKELLMLHKGDNKKLRIKIGHNNISQIKVGDVVNVEIKQENIPRNQYIILEITHLITGLMELELAKYSKKLEDRFSELAVDVDTAQTLQNTSNNEQSISLGFLETVNIKPIRLFVRKRATTGGATLGFTTALNTGTTPLGFTSGATITYTDLLEEEF